MRGAGEATLSLEARFITSDYENFNITLTVENPTTVTVVFDEVSEKVLPVTVDISQVSIAEGFILNRSSSVPAEVTLTGPTSELDTVASVTAVVTAGEALSDSVTLDTTLEMRMKTAMSSPRSTRRWTPTRPKSPSMSCRCGSCRWLWIFIGLPAGFDTSSLSYTLDRQTMRVAGPARTISTLTELSVASLDLGQNFAFDRDYQLNVELPDGIVSQDGVNTVTLTFDTSGMDTTTLNISNIRVINVPSDVNVEVLSSLVSNVQLYGPAEEIATLGADSIVAVVDCQSISVTTGQQTLPVSIQIPSSSRIFAVGSYTVQCEITTQ